VINADLLLADLRRAGAEPGARRDQPSSPRAADTPRNHRSNRLRSAARRLANRRPT